MIVCPPYAPAAMKFTLIDIVLEREANRIVAVKQVSLAEEYLGDHFPGFPVLPGVMMIEAMVQAARLMLAERPPTPAPGTPGIPRMGERLVLGEVKALKFGNMVRPGERLEVEVKLVGELEGGSFDCRGTGRVLRSEAAGESGGIAVSGRFTMRPVRANPPPG